MNYLEVTKLFNENYSLKKQNMFLADQLDKNIRKHIDPAKRQKFYDVYTREYTMRYPTNGTFWKVVNENNDLRMQLDTRYAQYEKRKEWRGIKLYHPSFADGEHCILCLAGPNDWNGHIVEKDEKGYDVLQKCACCGGDPKLTFREEWVAHCKSKGITDYNHWYYRHKMGKPNIDGETGEVKLKEM